MVTNTLNNCNSLKFLFMSKNMSLFFAKKATNDKLSSDDEFQFFLMWTPWVGNSWNPGTIAVVEVNLVSWPGYCMCSLQWWGLAPPDLDWGRFNLLPVIKWIYCWLFSAVSRDIEMLELSCDYLTVRRWSCDQPFKFFYKEAGLWD